jgi:hypothetical protein
VFGGNTLVFRLHQWFGGIVTIHRHIFALIMNAECFLVGKSDVSFHRVYFAGWGVFSSL